MYISVEVRLIDLVTDGRFDWGGKTWDLFSGGTEFESRLGRKRAFVL
jgi:hypothetical protein